MRLAIFDSGVGGVVVLARLRRLLPRADLLYVNDPDEVPYGAKTAAWVRARICGLLLPLKADAVVLACNTATAAAADTLRAQGVRTFGIEPAVRPAIAAGGRVCVLCTPLTARLRFAGSDLRILCEAELAVRVERALDLPTDAARRDALAALADELAPRLTESVVTGCTHYSFLAPRLTRLGFRVFDGADGLCRHVAAVTADEGSGTLVWCGRDESRLLPLAREAAEAVCGAGSAPKN